MLLIFALHPIFPKTLPPTISLSTLSYYAFSLWLESLCIVDLHSLSLFLSILLSFTTNMLPSALLSTRQSFCSSPNTPPHSLTHSLTPLTQSLIHHGTTQPTPYLLTYFLYYSLMLLACSSSPHSSSCILPCAAVTLHSCHNC